MTVKNGAGATHAAEIIAHLARLAYADGHVCGLTSAQWTALWFFKRASKFSRTLSAFADYHATSRASASQTVKSLELRGLIARTVCQDDRRRAQIDLTDKGRWICDRDPFGGLVQAISALPGERQNDLSEVLAMLLTSLGGDGQRQSLGTCSTCRFLKESSDNKVAATTYCCVLAGGSMSGSELDDICMKHRPRAPEDGNIC